MERNARRLELAVQRHARLSAALVHNRQQKAHAAVERVLLDQIGHCPSVNSDHDIQRNLMWSPSALCTGYPSVALRYSTYQMSPRSAKNVQLHIFCGKGTCLRTRSRTPGNTRGLLSSCSRFLPGAIGDENHFGFTRLVLGSTGFNGSDGR